MAEPSPPPAKALSRGRRRREGDNYFLYLTWEVGRGEERRAGGKNGGADPNVKGRVLRTLPSGEVGALCSGEVTLSVSKQSGV